LLAYLIRKVFLILSLMDLGIYAAIVPKSDPFAPWSSFQSYHCKLEQVVAYQNDVRRSNAFLMLEWAHQSGEVPQLRALQS
jgi:hypothetical protein